MLQVRERVIGIQRRLERGLRGVQALAAGSPAWSLEHLDELEALVQPLLGSPLVGEGAAFDAQAALAQSLPGQLGRQALSIAVALRLIELHKTGRASLLGLLASAVPRPAHWH